MEPIKKFETPENVFLVIETHLIPIRQSPFYIGRRLGNDLVINESGVSRLHAEIIYEDGEFIIFDKKTRNGTFINGEQIVEKKLKSGDTITLAGTPLLFIDRSEAFLRKALDETGTLNINKP